MPDLHFSVGENLPGKIFFQFKVGILLRAVFGAPFFLSKRNSSKQVIQQQDICRQNRQATNGK